MSALFAKFFRERGEQINHNYREIKMKKILLPFWIIITVFYSSKISAQNSFVSACVSNAFTVGNNTYVPVNLKEDPENKIETILWIIKTFADRNPQLVVMDWKIEGVRHTFFAGNSGIFGIWIHHKEKPDQDKNHITTPVRYRVPDN